MAAAVGVLMPAFVPARGGDTLEAAGIVGSWDEVLMMVVALTDVDAVYAP